LNYVHTYLYSNASRNPLVQWLYKGEKKRNEMKEE